MSIGKSPVTSLPSWKGSQIPTFRPISSPKSAADFPWMEVEDLNTLLLNKDLRSWRYSLKSYLAGFLSDLDERGENLNTSSYFTPRRALECRS